MYASNDSAHTLESDININATTIYMYIKLSSQIIILTKLKNHHQQVVIVVAKNHKITVQFFFYSHFFYISSVQTGY